MSPRAPRTGRPAQPVSGGACQLGVDPKSGALVAGGVVQQTHQVLRNLQTVLGGAGASLEQALMVRIYLADFARDYEAMNGVYATYFKPGRLPSRTTGGVTRLALGALVGIDLIVKIGG